MLSLALAITMCALSPLEDVFVSGTLEPGQAHPVYRIPALCQAQNGDLLAFSEARRSIADQSLNELVLRRRKKGETAWSAIEVVASDPSAAINNPCLLVTKEAIWLTYQRFPNGYNERNASADFNPETACYSYVISSRDHGKTWSKPTDITHTIKGPGVRSDAAGPGIGIQLARGRFKGRLVFPYNEGANGDYTAFAVFSDDNGHTWKRGSFMPKPSGTNPNECQVVELADGRLMMNARDQGPSKLRLVSFSADGGHTWSVAKPDPQLPDPTCQGSIVRLSWKPSILLFSNAASSAGRENGTMYASKDEGRTWSVAQRLTGQHESFQYSSLCPLASNEVAVLYETREISLKGEEGYRIKFTVRKVR